MKRLALLPLLLLACGPASAAVPTVTISGQVITPDGQAAVAGSITVRLSAPGSVVVDGAAARVASEVTKTLSVGGAVSGLSLVPNDLVLPGGTFYVAAYSVTARNGRRAAWVENWQLASAPTTLDIGAVPRKAASAFTGEVVSLAAVLPTITSAQEAAKAYTDQSLAAIGQLGTLSQSNGNALSVLVSGATTARTAAAELGDVFKPERFGCKGDGDGAGHGTDDYACWQALVAAVNSNGGGVIELKPRAVYRIDRYRIGGGPQANGNGWFVFANVNGLIIHGNGAKVDFKGDFNRSWDYSSGAPKFAKLSYRSTLGFMFTHSSKVSISDLEIDGNSELTTHDTDVVEDASNAIAWMGCSDVTITNLWAHHYPTDGMMIREWNDGTSTRVISKHFTVSNSVFEYNGRQGISINALRWGTFINSKFQHQGRAAYGGHPPQAGIDVEVDYWPGASAIGYTEADDYSGDLTFVGCHFENNVGQEFVTGMSKRRNSGATVTVDGPLIYPTTVIATQFIGTTGEQSRLVVTGRYTLFTGCHFRDLMVAPEWGADGPQAATHVFENSTFEHTNLSSSMIRWVVTDGELVVRNSRLLFKGTTPYVSAYPLWVQPSGTARAKLEGSYVWVDARYKYTTGRNTFLLWQGGEMVGNKWNTDLNTGGDFFAISGGTHTRETYLAAGFFSPGTALYSLSTYSTPPVAAQGASVAADVAALKTDFNALLTKLRTANVLAP